METPTRRVHVRALAYALCMCMVVSAVLPVFAAACVSGNDPQPVEAVSCHDTGTPEQSESSADCAAFVRSAACCCISDSQGTRPTGNATDTPAISPVPAPFLCALRPLDFVSPIIHFADPVSVTSIADIPHPPIVIVNQSFLI